MELNWDNAKAWEEKANEKKAPVFYYELRRNKTKSNGQRNQL